MTRLRYASLTLLLVAQTRCATTSSQVGSGTSTPAALKPRVVVTADPELDDSNSLVRYLLHSADFRTEGLIYASSQFHWKGDGTGRKWFVANREYRRFGLNLCPCESWRWAPDERFIHDAVEIYERVYPNLRVHDANYPPPAELKSKIRWGNIEFDGEMSKDTPGSDLIRSLLLDDEPGPLFLLAWGGQSTIARALKSIQDQYERTPQWPAIQQKVSRKAILSTSGDQDDSYANYIKPNWPGITLLSPGRNGVALGYGANGTVSAENAIYYGEPWTSENVSSRGPFGGFYRLWGDGKQMVKGDIFDYFGLSGFTAEELRAKGYAVWLPPRGKGEFLGEGDTFTYLNLVDNGLLGYRDDTPGGWAGDRQRSNDSMTFEAWQASQQRAGRDRPPSPNPNFTPAAQNAFAARLRWSTTSGYFDANHPPHAAIRGAARFPAHPGETVRLQGTVSDPDGNAVAVRWWQWREVGSYPGAISLVSPTSADASFVVPGDASAGQTIHLILEATDNGTPALTRYQRVVVSVAR